MNSSATYGQSIAQIARHLVVAAGADPRSLDANRLQWVVEARCRELKLDSANTYAEHLNSSRDELDALIDIVVIQETRFFRDPTVFHHLRLWLPQMAEQFPGPLRILSAPCSTGQEAYSLAATLQLAGIPLERFTIDALDISTTALATARTGIYPEDALRNASPEFRQACGTLQNKQWKMHDALRTRIDFQRCNLAEPEALHRLPGVPRTSGISRYHLILCRNLFIYLHAQARSALAESLHSALIPGGRLVIGTADRVDELSAVFQPHKPAASFAFTHREELISAPAVLNATSRTQTSAPAPMIATTPNAPPSIPAAGARNGSRSGVAGPAVSLYQAALLDQQHGDYRKSEKHCRQALYVDPGFLPALELLASLWIRHPSLRLRSALQARIERNRPPFDLPAPSGSSSHNPSDGADEMPASAWRAIP
jgi:chemotaxis protein methyltransferase WspC